MCKAFVKIALISCWNDFNLIPLGNCASIRGDLRKYAKNSNFENFKSVLYSTSVSMPLISIPLDKFGGEQYLTLCYLILETCGYNYTLLSTISSERSFASYSIYIQFAEIGIKETQSNSKCNTYISLSKSMHS